MYKISKKLLIANSLLALSAVTPYDCHAADDWKKFLHNWQSGLESSSEEEMNVEAQTPQRTPRFSSQSVYNIHYNQNKEDSSCEDSQSSVEEEMPNKTDIGQAQPEIQIPVIIPVPTPKIRNHHDAFGSSGAQSHPQKPFGMKKAKPNQLELSPTEQNRQLRIKELEEQQKANRIAFENNSNAKKAHFLTTQTKNEKDALQKEYEEAVYNLTLQLEQKKQLLIDSLSKGYNLLELNEHVERVKFNLLLEEQKKNVLFKDIFLGINDNQPGLPIEIWGNIFYHFCQGDSRSNFSLISKKFYEIARIFTHKINILAFHQVWNQDGERMFIECSLEDLKYILTNFPNLNHITVWNVKFPLLNILELAPNLKFLKLNNTLIRENDDFSNLMTNLKSLTITDGLYISPSFIQNSSKIDELSLCTNDKKDTNDKKEISITNDDLKLFTNLKSLNYSSFELSEDTFKELTNLTCLTLTHPNQMEGHTFQSDNALKHLTNLTSLTLPGNLLNITTYKLLTNLTSLNGYSLPSERVLEDNSGKIYISKPPATKIMLNSQHAYSMEPAILGDIQPFKVGVFDSLNKSNIEELDIRNSSNIKIKDFNDLKNLRILHLASRKTLTDNIFKPLTNLTSLYLDSNTKISDKAFDFLQNLKELSLVETTSDSFMDEYNVTDKGLQKLSKLTSLDLKENIYITDVGIQGLTSLTKLNLGKNELITNEGIKNLTNLKELNLGWNTNITAEGVKNMNQLVSIVQTRGLIYR